MSGLAGLVWLVPVPPLLAALALVFGRGLAWRPVAATAVGAVAVSLAVAMVVLVAVASGERAAPEVIWGSLAGRPLVVSFLADPLSALMGVLTTSVGLVVFVYAAAYMRDDAGYRRFFALFSLFVGGMLLLVVSGSLLLLYAAWELVGLTSFLLIGFYRQRQAPGRAAAKAFLVTRIGDLGLLVGVLLVYLTLGSFTIAAVNTAAASGALAGPALTAIALLVFMGAAGKSAQVPLHVWLPDAMEGPTPVSALLHSATMVAAGVFLVARLYPLFLAADSALAVVATIGAATAVLGAASAAAQRDLKRVLAYSTISQLGEMMAGLGAGALDAGLFHLVSQALFKACLFLAAGSVGHALGSTDLAVMGGLRRQMPRTFLAFVLGAWALAGIPPFSGFWSGDAVLGALWVRFPVLFWVVLLAIGLAGFYSARALLLAFGGARRSAATVHEGPVWLWAPAVLLGILAAFGGVVDGPFSGRPLARFLGVGTGAETANLLVTGLALAASAAGIGVAVARYAAAVAHPAWRLGTPKGFGGLAVRGFGFDQLYAATLVRATGVVAALLAAFDARVVEGLVQRAGLAVRVLAGRLRGFDARVLDRAANGSAGFTLRAAQGSERWDARRLDRAVGRFALAWRGASGRLALTQSGRVNEYFLGVVLWGGGTLLLVALVVARG
ncbi:MAG: NADH-quinone oxidoreductase subunit L [Chloroflexi bacterium]|nr:NADH-quinone oxidoreductase subunit L [Chloroflexota bacterium]